MRIILDYSSALRADFIHANGEKGTEVLLDKLNIRGHEKIVEYGFGTGATLVKLKSRYPSVSLKGIDASHSMKKVALDRIQFCGLKNKIELLHVDNKDSIPKNSIDIVYIESVLGILEGSVLKNTVGYIYSILKRNGILAINESIWMEYIETKQIEFINQKCKTKFGIVQCNMDFKSIKDTISFFKAFNFKNLSYERIRNNEKSTSKALSFKEKKSKLFTLFGKLKLVYDLKLKKEAKKYNTEITTIFESDKEYLTGVIMVFQKA